MQWFLRLLLAAATALISMLLNPSTPRVPQAKTAQTDSFTFAVTADIRIYAGPGDYDTLSYFRGAVQSLFDQGAGAFMLGPGDIDPPAGIRWTIDQVLGTGYLWYPVAGNHETETPEEMAWLRAYDYGTVNPGPAACPETTFSFDYANAHFTILNEYCDSGGDSVTDGDVPDYLYSWLASDLAATNQPFIFVVGHEPAFPLPDMDNGRLRHETDSLNAHPENRDRFWTLLFQYDAIYLCGHTHNTSVAFIGGVWQLDVGHARGLGDTGARSTYLRITVNGDMVSYEVFRDDAAGGAYTLMHSGELIGYQVFLPVIQH